MSGLDISLATTEEQIQEARNFALLPYACTPVPEVLQRIMDSDAIQWVVVKHENQIRSEIAITVHPPPAVTINEDNRFHGRINMRFMNLPAAEALGYERADLTSAMAVGFATLIPFPGCCRNRVVVGGPPDSVQEMIDDLVGHELVGDWQFEYEDSNTGMVTYSVRVY